MRTDVLDLMNFYAGPLGGAAREAIAVRLEEALGDGKGLRIAGFGYAGPFLSLFSGAERCVSFAPAAQGVHAWPEERADDRLEGGAGGGRVALVEDAHWPVPDAMFDVVIVVHGLEETARPRRLMREIWRVLANDGRVIIIAPNRSGPWAMFDASPFAAGRPYLKGQLERLLSETSFAPAAWSAALFFPPASWRFLLRSAPAFERAGARAWSGLAGALLVEARKETMAPALSARIVRAPSRTPVVAPRPATRPATLSQERRLGRRWGRAG